MMMVHWRMFSFLRVNISKLMCSHEYLSYSLKILIIITGPSRTGKSTLARKINEELNYFVFSVDKLVAVFQEAYPQLNIRLNWNREKNATNLAPFLGHFLVITYRLKVYRTNLV
jgi:uridine kinase